MVSSYFVVSKSSWHLALVTMAASDQIGQTPIPAVTRCQVEMTEAMGNQRPATMAESLMMMTPDRTALTRLNQETPTRQTNCFPPANRPS